MPLTLSCWVWAQSLPKAAAAATEAVVKHVAGSDASTGAAPASPGKQAKIAAVPKVRGKQPPIKPQPMPFDPRLVVFPYDANYTYPILTKVDAFTHIKLQDGERVVGFYLSDTLRWPAKLAATKQDIFIKPTGEDQETVGTLITNRRRYELSFSAVSGDAGGTWYQRVSWDVDHGFFEDGPGAEGDATPVRASQATSPHAAFPAVRPVVEPAGQGAPVGIGGFQGADSKARAMVQLEKLNFAYAIEGDGPFKPTMVFDDGRFTWLKMPHVQQLPALFAIGVNGLAEPLDYIPPRGADSDYYQVPRLLPHGALLKLGKEEVRIKNMHEGCGGWFKPDCQPMAPNIRRN